MTRYEACSRCDCPVPLDLCVAYPVLCVLCRIERRAAAPSDEARAVGRTARQET